MNLATWSELTKLKADLLDIADTLLTDHVITNEEITLKLLQCVENLSGVEKDIISHFKKNRFYYKF